MDLLRSQWLEVPRSSTRPQAAPSIFPPQQLPKASPVSPSPFIGPEDTYSNIGLAAIPRASLASSPVVWAGTRLTIGCARPGPGARPLVAEYACIQKLKGTGQGPQELQQGTAERIPTAQVDILYSRVCKSESRDPGLIKNQADLKGGGSILAPRNDLTCGLTQMPKLWYLRLFWFPSEAIGGQGEDKPSRCGFQDREACWAAARGPSMGGGFAGLEFALPQEPQAADLGTPGTWAGAAGLPTPSGHIPVPAQRSPPGKARLDEVLAAAALTSLSTSPLYLGAPAVSFSPEPDLEPWREALTQPTGSYSSSSNSGDWVWDQASDQSSPSTPSSPLPPEAAHFLFGEPTQRKRKVSWRSPGRVDSSAAPDTHPVAQSAVQVVFQCLWKSCGKVLRTASAIQRHIRLVHLGRREKPEHSDGEEDFYYTELDIGVDMLTNGLSNLAPTSPEAPVPPAFPHLDLPSLLRPLALPRPLPPLLSSAAPPKTCHGDHAHHAGEATGGSWEQVSGHSGEERSPSCSSPQGCLAPVHVDPQPTEGQATGPALPSKLGASLRKPRGDAKKCRKVYGTDHRDLWCTACRWKKACQRFLD
ncbi:SLC2A4 regulator isoform 5-T6 [Callospermophilus lateralis]